MSSNLDFSVKSKDGKLVAYRNKNSDFTCFGVITDCTQTEVQIRMICFTMQMQNTEVKALCGGTRKMFLNSRYVASRFAAYKIFMMLYRRWTRFISAFYD